jgi:hypothetical protein
MDAKGRASYQDKESSFSGATSSFSELVRSQYDRMSATSFHQLLRYSHPIALACQSNTKELPNFVGTKPALAAPEQVQ